ncbi:histone-fold-containing protein [Stemphylium lycopersici]|uniref:DNA polymerase epsilon subunit D n=1 Tax=Stemphylium lycopersici TaxID=183478 RepID=A0A364N1K2_STELY|nr:histone-fold-containing protein [Stemphylium lycopersici]RAQ99634.1 histone-fold-containing protein [Stemphylium lycopersici]RAR09412.1 histone-fold-containing protein [Stemphylium lycopersici]
MPPKKNNVSAVSNEESPAAPRSAPRDDSLGVEDLNLPKSIVQRLAKGVLPPNTQIQKDALLAMSKSATVFVNYITSCAAEKALSSGKKTVMPKDVFDAMSDLEFAFMLPRLEAEVTKFTSIQADKRNTYRKKVREEKKAVSSTGAAPASTPTKPTDNGDVVMEGAEEGGERATKRARRESGDDDNNINNNAEGDVSEEEGDETADVEDEEVEDDEIEEEVEEERLVEDPLEEKENKEDDDDEDGNDSD